MSTARIAVAGASVAVLALAGAMVTKWEGRSLDPYQDVKKVWTVCDGETAVPMRRYTPAECDAMRERSLRAHAGPVLSCIPEAAPDKVKAAFVSLAYNVGAGQDGACGSKAAEHARAGRYLQACDAFMGWNKITVAPGQPWPCRPDKRVILKSGKRLCIIDGLTNRRADERCLCRSAFIVKDPQCSKP